MKLLHCTTLRVTVNNRWHVLYPAMRHLNGKLRVFVLEPAAGHSAHVKIRCAQFVSHQAGKPMSRYELAQLNIAILRAPLDSPPLADFVANLDRINAVAEQSPGFVWRLETDDGDATALRPLGENALVNMSVWKDVAALRSYVYRSAHVEVMARRKEWFEHMAQAYFVLWWVKQGHRPTISEAISRLELLRTAGPTAEAFTFRQAYLPPDSPRQAVPFDIGDECAC